jgi:hypothetical protein
MNLTSFRDFDGSRLSQVAEINLSISWTKVNYLVVGFRKKTGEVGT